MTLVCSCARLQKDLDFGNEFVECLNCIQEHTNFGLLLCWEKTSYFNGIWDDISDLSMFFTSY